MQEPFGSIRRPGEPRIFRLGLWAQTALADDQRSIDLGILVCIDAIALGLGGGARYARRAGSRTRPIGILAGTVPGIASGREGGIRGQMSLRGHSTSGERQREQENDGRFDHDAVLCTRELKQVAPIMFKIP